jgi:hypothetical protein
MEPLSEASTLVLIVLVTAVAAEAAQALITGTTARFSDDWLQWIGCTTQLLVAAVCGIEHSATVTSGTGDRPRSDRPPPRVPFSGSERSNVSRAITAAGVMP